MSNPDFWFAPAKLNLMLRIVGRRSDGYHTLQTVFQLIDIADRLQFQVRADGVISRKRPLPGVAEKDDLIIRAANLLKCESGSPLGADISLEKRLPMGGGLGGGSSDAATTLIALNRLWRTGLSKRHLAELGLKLGADVPLFIHGETAWGEGIGEKLTTVALPRHWYLILLPSCHVSTAEIFSDPDLTRDSPRMTIRDFLAGSMGNDCLPVVSRRYPEVADALRWLKGFSEPRLTGTGACVFAAFASESEANDVLRQVPQQYQGFVARGINRSPVWEFVPA